MIMRCVHGHAVVPFAAGGEARCACAVGYEGARCDIDALAACRIERVTIARLLNRSSKTDHAGAALIPAAILRFRIHRARFSCDLLSLLSITDPSPSCECLDACASYLRRVAAAATDKWQSMPIVLRSPPPCASATSLRGIFVAGEVNRAALWRPIQVHASTRLISVDYHVSTTSCFADCNGRGHCRGHFCECDAGTVGSACRPRASVRAEKEHARSSRRGDGLTPALVDAETPTHWPPSASGDVCSAFEAVSKPRLPELRVRLLELPAALRYELAGRYMRPGARGQPIEFGSASLFDKRTIYWAQVCACTARACPAHTPTCVSGAMFSERQGYFYSQLVRDEIVAVNEAGVDTIVAYDTGFDLGRRDIARLANHSFEYTVLLTFASSDRPRADSERRTVRMHPHCPRPSAASPRRWPVDCCFHAERDICLPPLDAMHSLPLEAFNARPVTPSGRSTSSPSSPTASQRDAFFDPATKSGLDLYFVGNVGKDSAECNASCYGNLSLLVAAQSAEGLPRWRRRCTLCYSGGMRQFLAHRFGHSPRMLIGQPAPRHRRLGGVLQARAKFCLVAGGVGFDMRITSAVLNGCIPLWTNRFAWPPLFRVLRHDRLLVAFEDSLADRQRFVKLAALPAFLDCYEPVRASLLANLRLAWPAFVWGNGTAYEHVLLELALISRKQASGALSRILACHGPRYVGEVMRVPLDGYDEGQVPGLGRARTFRRRLAANDPLGSQLQQVAACVAAIDVIEG